MRRFLFLSSISALTEFLNLFKRKIVEKWYILRINWIWQLILIDDFFPIYPYYYNQSFNIVFFKLIQMKFDYFIGKSLDKSK